jgi:hypothetical protein
VAVAVCGVLGGTRLLSAQEAPPVPAEAAPAEAAPVEAAKPTEDASATEARAESDAEAKAKAEQDPAEDRPATPPPKAVGATPGRFEPTEKVRADFDVSFPIDI